MTRRGEVASRQAHNLEIASANLAAATHSRNPLRGGPCPFRDPFDPVPTQLLEPILDHPPLFFLRGAP